MRPHLTAAEQFLERFHNQQSSATSRSLGMGSLSTGQSSYEQLASAIPKGTRSARVLELACGDGHLVAPLADRVDSLDYIGVDISENDLAIACERHLSESVRFVRGRAQDAHAAPGSVDFVLCHMALMLFDELDAVVANIATVLKPGVIATAKN